MVRARRHAAEKEAAASVLKAEELKLENDLAAAGLALSKTRTKESYAGFIADVVLATKSLGKGGRSQRLANDRFLGSGMQMAKAVCSGLKVMSGVDAATAREAVRNCGTLVDQCTRAPVVRRAGAADGLKAATGGVALPKSMTKGRGKSKSKGSSDGKTKTNSSGDDDDDVGTCADEVDGVLREAFDVGRLTGGEFDARKPFAQTVAGASFAAGEVSAPAGTGTLVVTLRRRDVDDEGGEGGEADDVDVTSSTEMPRKGHARDVIVREEFAEEGGDGDRRLRGDASHASHGNAFTCGMCKLLLPVMSHHARRDSAAEDFSRLGALLFTATAWIFIPAYCFAIP